MGAIHRESSLGDRRDRGRTTHSDAARISPLLFEGNDLRQPSGLPGFDLIQHRLHGAERVGVGGFELAGVVGTVTGGHAALKTERVAAGSPGFQGVVRRSERFEPRLNVGELITAGRRRTGGRGACGRCSGSG